MSPRIKTPAAPLLGPLRIFTHATPMELSTRIIVYKYKRIIL